MPNYVAHELFGEQVKKRLQGPLKQAVEQDTEAFRTGLYGPDPLLFLPSPAGAVHARQLHRHWEEMTGPLLQEMLAWGTPGQQSFAVGYLCHMMLDDICHEKIYGWMAKGFSHRCLEVGLDWLILEETGEKRFPSPHVPEGKRIGNLAARVIFPISAMEYRVGLASMGLICSQMTKIGKLYRRRMKSSYIGPILELLETLYATVDPVLCRIDLYLEQAMEQAGVELLPAASY